MTNRGGPGGFDLSISSPSEDANNDTIPDDCQGNDRDNDGVNDAVDQDDDNDGVLDTIEFGNCTSGIINTIISDDFGTGGRTTNPFTNYCYEDGTGTATCSGFPGIVAVNDGEYAVVQHPNPDASNFSTWTTQGDHTGNTDGRMMVVNASIEADEFYRRTITVGANSLLTVDLWILNVINPGTNVILPDVAISIETLAGLQIGTPITTGSIPENGTWNNYSVSFDPGLNTQIQVVLTNNGPGGSGNDLALDDITVTQLVCDTDNDLIPDFLDLDSDNDGIPDTIEAQSTANYNAPGAVDPLTGIPAIGTDTDGIGSFENSDADGIPDYLDLDSDNDGIYDIVETGNGSLDTDSDGQTNEAYGINGLTNSMDTSDDYQDPDGTLNDPTTLPNSQNSTTPQVDYREVTPPLDSDGDGYPDSVDLDDDNDGILDTVECADANAVGNTDNSTGDFAAELAFIEWTGDFADGIDIGDSLTQTLSDGSTITLTVLAANTGAKYFVPNNISTFGGALLQTEYDDADDNYALYVQNANRGSELSVTFQVTGTLTNGTNFTPSVVFTDGESTDSGETNSAVTNGSSWVLIDEVAYNGAGPTITGLGSQYVILADTNRGVPLLRSDKVSQLTFGTTDIPGASTGRQGFTIGFLTYADQDQDGIINCYDLDTDGDGCPDALEGAGTFTATDIDANGMLVGPVDGNGVPNAALGGQATTTAVTDATDTAACAPPTDTDNDGIADDVDLDDDNDGILDTVEGTGDTDGDGIPDYLDLDSDNDGIPDIIEAGGTDADGDGQIDYPTPGDPMSMNDTNNDGLDDGVAASPLPDTDSDNDGLVDRLDLDSDNDGIADIIEAGGTDANADGQVDYATPGDPMTIVDIDRDGFIDTIDTDNNTVAGVGDGGTALPDTNTDGDTLPNRLDLDSDNDGIHDVVESGGTDADGNGRADDDDDNADNTASNGIPTSAGGGNTPTETTAGTPDYVNLDSDADGCSDANEAYTDGNADGGDGAQYGTGTPAATGVNGLTAAAYNTGAVAAVTDATDTAACAPPTDTDNDGIADNVDLDDDNDGILDTVEGTGDTDGDGIPDYLDLDSDNDGIADITEAGGTDADGDGQIDYPTPGDPMSMNDTNDDGLDDGVAASPLPDTDSDNDGLVDRLDLDSDNDGIADIIEAGGTDANADGQVDYATPGDPMTMVDVDRDGFIDTIDTDNNTIAGVGDGGTALPDTNTDGDTLPNRLDLDSDNDGIHDVVESGGADADGNGRADDDDNNVNNTASNGIPTSAGGGNTPTETTAGTPDYVNLDSDADGCSDANEAYTDGNADGGDGAQYGTGTPAATGVNGLVTAAAYNTGAVAAVTDATDAAACAPPGVPDTDNDGITDDVDLDDDNDGILDTVEGTGDTDGDGIPDYLDLDSDNDGVPDITEAGGTDVDGDGQIDYPTPGDPMSMNDTNDDGLDDGVAASPLPDADFDGDGLIDRLDLDSDNDGIADIIEAGGTDANADGQVDYATPGDPMTMVDIDRDGFIDTIDTDNNTIAGVGDGGTALPDTDTDGPGFPNRLDLDSDNDGIYDVVESGGTDADGNGRADDDDDNVDNTASNGIPTSAGGGNTPTDTGADGSPDYTNLDSDGDGCSDANEAYANANADGGDNGVFGFGIPTTDASGLVTAASYDTGAVATVTDATDATACDKIDSDGDGVLDDQEIADGTDPNNPCNFVMASITETQTGNYLAADCDGDGVTNEQEITDSTNPEDPCDFIAASATVTPSGDYLISDCDGDGVANGTELSDGTNPADPCDFIRTKVSLDQTGDYLTADCDGDTIPNGREITDGTNPDDPCSSRGGTPPTGSICDIFIDNELVGPQVDAGFWRIGNIDTYPNNTVRIYNRWGILVYETTGYDNGSNNFRGFSEGRATIQEDKALPVGVYFYVIDYVNNGESKAKSGYLYVNR